MAYFDVQSPSVYRDVCIHRVDDASSDGVVFSFREVSAFDVVNSCFADEVSARLGVDFLLDYYGGRAEFGAVFVL